MTDHERAYWLADKIPAYGDYAKEAACVLRKQADEIDRLTRELADLKADRDSWIEQASQRAQETVEAMQQVEAYRLRCEALHSAPQEPPSCPEGHGTMAGYFGGWRCNYCGCKAGAASGARVNSAASAPREPLTDEDRTRAAFEAWHSDSGRWPKAVERYGEGYKLAQTHEAWVAWQGAWSASAAVERNRWMQAVARADLQIGDGHIEAARKTLDAAMDWPGLA